MINKRNNYYNSLDDEFDIDEAFSGETRKTRKANSRRRCRLSTKRRLDDHEEYLWKKRNGWFDDELYTGFDEQPSVSTVL